MKGTLVGSSLDQSVRNNIIYFTARSMHSMVRLFNTSLFYSVAVHNKFVYTDVV
jgi:hypothetical protein